LRWENPPEGARNLQGYLRDTWEHIPPLGFTRIDRKLNWAQKGWKRNSLPREMEREKTEGEEAAHRARAEEHWDEVAGEQIAGEEGWSPTRGGDRQRLRERGREQREVTARPRAREGKVF
jgi:hypothetical protein